MNNEATSGSAGRSFNHWWFLSLLSLCSGRICCMSPHQAYCVVHTFILLQNLAEAPLSFHWSIPNNNNGLQRTLYKQVPPTSHFGQEYPKNSKQAINGKSWREATRVTCELCSSQAVLYSLSLHHTVHWPGRVGVDGREWENGVWATHRLGTLQQKQRQGP